MSMLKWEKVKNMWKKPVINEKEFELGGFNDVEMNEVADIDGEGGAGFGICVFVGYCCWSSGQFGGFGVCVIAGGYLVD